MTQRLIIVESPSKAKHIQHYVEPGDRVVASFGHVRDLPKKEMGVERPNYVPTYVPTEKGARTLSQLRKEMYGVDMVILASDPDREGEGIAWHLREALKLKPGQYQRVTYGEVTKSAIQHALANPRDIDMKLVAAQEARRVLDRLVGYRLSFPLGDAINAGLDWEKRQERQASAGRVQTPVLRLIVEREEEINKFKSTKHYSVILTTEFGFDATWDTKPFLSDEKPYVTDRLLAMQAASPRTITVMEQATKRRTRRPNPPFTTSTMQQVASVRLKINSTKIMDAAQKLFEAGAITYHRTDSVNLASEAVDAIRAYAKSKGLPLPDKPQVYENKESAQEAHEAVRPVDPTILRADGYPKGKDLTIDALRLYEIIHERAIACQLADKVDDVTTLVAVGEVQGKEFQYQAKAVRNVEPGFTVLTKVDEKDESVDMPPLEKGQVIKVDKGEVKDRKTNPPPRFTEATLLAQLDKLGIGRPSTWAGILANITGKKFIHIDKKSLQYSPTQLGKDIIDRVRPTTFAGIDFTSTMEHHLDLIAKGKSRFVDVVQVMDEIIDEDLEIIRTGKVPTTE